MTGVSSGPHAATNSATGKTPTSGNIQSKLSGGPGGPLISTNFRGEDEAVGGNGRVQTPTAKKIRQALVNSLYSRYLYANLLYVVYCVGIFFVNYGGYKKEYVDRLYLIWGVLHLVDAFLYAWAWKGRELRDPVMWPEYLNIVGAILYLWSASMYPLEDAPTYMNSATHKVHAIETTASLIELVATLGWTWSWWATFQRVPGRGLTLDDPDVWALLTLYVGSVIYFVYNIQILRDPSTYATNFLYTYGDIFYFMNSILYLLSCLRDDGWFWFMPVAGMFPTPEEERLLKKTLLKAKVYGTTEEALVDIHVRAGRQHDDEDDGEDTQLSAQAAGAFAF